MHSRVSPSTSPAPAHLDEQLAPIPHSFSVQPFGLQDIASTYSATVPPIDATLFIVSCFSIFLYCLDIPKLSRLIFPKQLLWSGISIPYLSVSFIPPIKKGIFPEPIGVPEIYPGETPEIYLLLMILFSWRRLHVIYT